MGAAAEWGRRGGRYLQAEALAAGDEDAAAAACRSSTSWAPPVQRPPAQAAAPPRVRPGAPRARPTTAAHVAGLTARQAEILAMVGAGMSKAEIAERLVVSVRTVDHHVSPVLAKLGVTNRRQVAEMAERMAARTADPGR